MMRSKKLFIDCRLMEGSGITTYINNLVGVLNKKNQDIEINYLLKDLNSNSFPEIPLNYKHLYDASIYSISEQLSYKKIIKENDILHVPHYNAPLLFPGKLIVTVHDICHYALKQFFPGIQKRIYASIFMKLILNKAEKIITVSEFTKKEIIKHFQVDYRKINVIYNGIDSHYYPRDKNKVNQIINQYELEENYLLYVGNIKAHKNISNLILSYCIAKKKENKLPQLVICGEQDEDYDVISSVLMQDPNLEHQINANVKFLGYVQYEHLPYLYTGASIFIFPSLYEGFGFPPLEAMSCGTPVIASKDSSMPEILGESAYYVNPSNSVEIADAIEYLWINLPLKEELRAKGFKQVKRYDWNVSGSKHLELYERISNPRKNILFVDQYGDYYGGGQVILMDIIDKINSKKEWNINVALPEHGSFSRLLMEKGYNLEICRVAAHDTTKNPYIDALIYLFSSIRSSIHLYKIIKSNYIDILYCNGGRIFLMSWIIGRFMKIEIVWHLHLMYSGRQKISVQLFGLSKSISKIFAVSHTAKKIFIGKNIYNKIKVHHNWVKQSFFKTSTLLTEIHPVAPIKAIIIGRITIEKGQYQFLEKIENMGNNSIEINFAGDLSEVISYRKKFYDKVNLLTEKGFKLKLFGFTNNVAELLDQHQFLFITSIEPESFGITAIEAMARGVIVIANKTGSLPEIITHEETGLFFDMNEPQSLKKLLDELYKNNFNLKKIQMQAYKMVKSKFIAENQLNQLIDDLELIAS